MPLMQLRPTFDIPLTEDRQQAIAKLESEYARIGKLENFLMCGEYGEIHLPPAEHRLWSPHLSFYVAQSQERCLIHGRFAPRLEVWTFVWVIYLAMAFTAFFGLALAYSQWMLGEAGWGGWVAGAALLIMMVLHLVASLGQQLSSDQMETLRLRLDKIIQDAGLVAEDGQAATIAAASQAVQSH